MVFYICQLVCPEKELWPTVIKNTNQSFSSDSQFSHYNGAEEEGQEGGQPPPLLLYMIAIFVATIVRKTVLTRF